MSIFFNLPHLFKILDSAHQKIFAGKPFSLLKTKRSKDYAALIVKECGVTEKAIQKILEETFEADAFIRDVIKKNHEAGAQAEALFEGYRDAIKALEKLANHKAVVSDTTFSGCVKGRGQVTLTEAIRGDIKELKKRRAHWAGLFVVHPETKAEPIPKSATAMLANQAYCLFRYIERHEKTADWDFVPLFTRELISELFTAIYSHSHFAPERFTEKKIKQYLDNAKGKYKALRKTSIRKLVESL